jgi:hypothetical protein
MLTLGILYSVSLDHSRADRLLSLVVLKHSLFPYSQVSQSNMFHRQYSTCTDPPRVLQYLWAKPIERNGTERNESVTGIESNLIHCAASTRQASVHRCANSRLGFCTADRRLGAVRRHGGGSHSVIVVSRFVLYCARCR